MSSVSTVSASRHILVVDDDPHVRRAIVLATRTYGEPLTATSVAEGRALLDEPFSWRALFFDLRLPDGSGLDLLAWSREKLPAAPAALLTGHVEGEIVNAAFDLGATVLAKPADTERIRRFLDDEPIVAARRRGLRSHTANARVHDLCARLRRAREAGNRDASARYAIGAAIAELKANPESYGDGAVSRAAAVLGEDVPTMYRYARVAECWDAAEFDRLRCRKMASGSPLSWSHFVALAGVPLPGRERYLARCLEASLSARALTALLNDDLDPDRRGD